LERTKSTAIAEASDLLIISSYMVNNISGTSGIVRFKTLAASAPFMRGIAKSKIIKSGFSSFAFSIASTPSVASPQISKHVWFSTKARMSVRIVQLTSAIRMHFDIAAPPGTHHQQIGKPKALSIQNNTGIPVAGFDILARSISSCGFF
jgi:hypothetical protein